MWECSLCILAFCTEYPEQDQMCWWQPHFKNCLIIKRDDVIRFHDWSSLVFSKVDKPWAVGVQIQTIIQGIQAPHFWVHRNSWKSQMLVSNVCYDMKAVALFFPARGTLCFWKRKNYSNKVQLYKTLNC